MRKNYAATFGKSEIKDRKSVEFIAAQKLPSPVIFRRKVTNRERGWGWGEIQKSKIINRKLYIRITNDQYSKWKNYAATFGKSEIRFQTLAGLDLLLSHLEWFALWKSTFWLLSCQSDETSSKGQKENEDESGKIVSKYSMYLTGEFDWRFSFPASEWSFRNDTIAGV